MLFLVQEVPATVASEQLNTALSADIQAPATAAGAPGGVSVALVFLLMVMLSVLVALALALRARGRLGPAGGGRKHLSHARGVPGRSAGWSPQPRRGEPDVLHLPPHVVAVLAERSRARRASPRPRPPEPDAERAGQEAGGGGSPGTTGLDILIGS